MELCNCRDSEFVMMAGDIVCTSCGGILNQCFPEHDPHRYVIEESGNIVDRNNFMMRYLEARSNEKITA